MNRRKFLERTGASLALSPWLRGQTAAHVSIDLKNCTVVYPEGASPREKKAAAVLVEEAAKRSGLEWRAQAGGHVTTQSVIYLATRSKMPNLTPEGYSIRIESQQIFITGAD